VSLDSQDNPIDRRTPIAILICVLIFLAWQKLYLEPRSVQAPPAPAAQTAQAPTGTPVTGTTPPAVGIPTARASAELVSKPMATGTGEALISNGPYLFSGWQLKSYRRGLGQETPSVELQDVVKRDREVLLTFDDPALAYLATDSVRGALEQRGAGYVWSYEDANVKLTREFSPLADKPAVDVKLTAEFKTRVPARALVSIGSQPVADDPEAHDRQLVYFTGKSLERERVTDIERTEVATPVRYIGATSRYFVMALLNQGAAEPKGLLEPIAAPPGGGRAHLVFPVTGKSAVIPIRVYFGPKEIDLLRSVDPALDHTVELGMFTVIAYPLLSILKQFYKWFHNYGIAIILLTILVKLVLYPLTYKSMKSMKQMAKVQPQLQRLREKYKDDREALNREMLTLMRSHGYNPMSGCLPILVQMPVFFALYQVLYSSIELFHAPFFFWIHDLSAKDPYFVTPVLLTLTMYVQQKLTPQTATDPAQQKMLQFMPIMFGAFMIALPSGLTLYMLVNAIVSIAQQTYLNKKFA
jgi:YidC/Oxa1 family membrane protein insertase